MQSGELWFPTVKGVVVVDPMRLRVNSLEPPVILERVLVDDREIAHLHLSELGSGTQKLEFHYTALSFLAPEKIRFRYRLQGFDSDWIDAGSRRAAYYTNLGPGEYRFQVIACNNDGVWNEVGDSWVFLLPTPAWSTWWAYCLYLAAVTAVVYAAVRLRLQALARRTRLLEAMVAERTAEVEDKNRALAGKLHELEISERRASESKQRALEANRAKSVFLSTMSHELRTPLNSIIGFASILLQRLPGKVEERYERFLTNILTSGQHLLGLINDVLDLSKIEAGRMELLAESVNVASILESVQNVMRGVTTEQQINIEVELPPDLPEITADAAKLKQIMFNLLSNAVKFSPRGSTVTVRARHLDGEQSPLGLESVQIDVVDRGIGIRQEDQEVIFEAFRQADSSATRRYEGTGLGLALVRRLLSIHGGEVTVESEPGSGSTFTVDLPVVARELRAFKAVAGKKVPEATAAPAAPESSLAPMMKVLVVEDEPVSFHALASALEGEGYTVVGARDGEEALEVAEKERPAVISLDLVLPRLDGWDVLKHLKSKPSTRRIPVVIVTVLENRELGLALGADDFFVKPVDRNAFIQRVDQLARQHEPTEGRPKILVVDDDPAVHDLLGAELESEGYATLRADDGPQGIELARSELPALVVLDLLMPGMSGFEVAFELRADPATANVPIIVLTAKDLTVADRELLSGRIASLIPKGADSTQRLTDAIRDLLKRS
jgi:signal transduction histidine kinase/CheY-like chemotaxis protein